MIKNHAPYLKAVLFPNNLAEVGSSVNQSQCFTVQDYHYHCFRERDEQGNPYGNIRSGYLEFSIVVSGLDTYKHFYKCMDQNENVPFSFIFNASFSKTGRINDFEDGLITYGYVVDIQESCDNHDNRGQEQLLLHVKVLLSNLIFIGNEQIHLLEITKD